MNNNQQHLKMLIPCITILIFIGIIVPMSIKIRDTLQTDNDSTNIKQLDSLGLKTANNQVNPAPTAKPSDSADGITITIENITRQNGKTVVEIAMNNHSYDLSSFDIYSRTKLSGVPLSNYRIIQSGSGGHHVYGELTFNQELAGQLIIGLGQNLTFNFNLK